MYHASAGGGVSGTGLTLPTKDSPSVGRNDHVVRIAHVRKAGSVERDVRAVLAFLDDVRICSNIPRCSRGILGVSCTIELDDRVENEIPSPRGGQ